MLREKMPADGWVCGVVLPTSGVPCQVCLNKAQQIGGKENTE